MVLMTFKRREAEDVVWQNTYLSFACWQQMPPSLRGRRETLMTRFLRHLKLPVTVVYIILVDSCIPTREMSLSNKESNNAVTPCLKINDTWNVTETEILEFSGARRKAPWQQNLSLQFHNLGSNHGINLHPREENPIDNNSKTVPDIT